MNTFLINNDNASIVEMFVSCPLDGTVNDLSDGCACEACSRAIPFNETAVVKTVHGTFYYCYNCYARRMNMFMINGGRIEFTPDTPQYCRSCGELNDTVIERCGDAGIGETYAVCPACGAVDDMVDGCECAACGKAIPLDEASFVDTKFGEFYYCDGCYDSAAEMEQDCMFE